jgi:hypothetical protein
MQVGFFYTAPGKARVHVTAEIPGTAFEMSKKGGRQHASLNVLGIATTAAGEVGGRFSDTVEFDFPGKKETDQFRRATYRYEADFSVGAGNYNLRVVFSPDRERFARLEVPLAVDAWDGEHFALSGIALSRESRTVSGPAQPEYPLTVGGGTALISRGLQFIPTGSNRYRKSDPAMLYVEIYEPLLLEPDPPKVLIQLVVVDRNSGAVKIDSGRLDMTDRILPGNPVVPVGLKVPLESLQPGKYAIVLKATDSAGNVSAVRRADFDLE